MERYGFSAEMSVQSARGQPDPVGSHISNTSNNGGHKHEFFKKPHTEPKYCHKHVNTSWPSKRSSEFLAVQHSSK